MNILIPHSWLLEYLETQAQPQQIADCLSLCGPSVESLEKVKSDWLYDFEVTTNRVDMMSVMGIAREAAAILPRFGLKAKFKPSQPPAIKPANRLKLKIEDKSQLCPRILGVVLDEVKLGPAPAKIVKRLEMVGLRGLNNVVDITNYVVTEIGQPCHVFDYDLIKSKRFLLRRAKPGEKIVSLENKEYRLLGGDIIIDDGSGQIIDLPGIIGTANSVVNSQTKRIVFFIETNNPVQMRQTSMTLGIRTVAATLNEKGVDPKTAELGLKRGVQLIKQLTGGRVASPVYDLYPKPLKEKTVSLPLQLIKLRIGIKIKAKETKKILDSLGFSTQIDKNDLVKVKVPSWRHKDINIAEDIVEEVARIYGYHRLPSQLMASPIPTNYPDEDFELEQRLKLNLVGLGLTELYTNSMVSQKLVDWSNLETKDHLKIKNALSEDWLYLRRSLIPSHLEAINLNPHQNSLQFFEIANVYYPRRQQLPEEQLQLIISTTDDYLTLKGMVEALLTSLKLKPKFEAVPEAEAIWQNQQTAEIKVKNQFIGNLGQVKLPADYAYKQVAMAVFDLRSLLKLSQRYPNYQPISAYPPIIEDLTFTLKPKTYVGQVIKTLQSSQALVKEVKLTKIYQQNYTFSLSYQSQTKALTNKSLGPVRRKIVNQMKKLYSANLVGKV